MLLCTSYLNMRRPLLHIPVCSVFLFSFFLAFFQFSVFPFPFFTRPPFFPKFYGAIFFFNFMIDCCCTLFFSSFLFFTLYLCTHLSFVVSMIEVLSLTIYILFSISSSSRLFFLFLFFLSNFASIDI